MNSFFVSLLLILCTLAEKIKGDCIAEECVRLSVAALIPARAGSKGIKHKNLSRIGNETLLARTLKTIHKSGRFDSVWVSTDGKEIADEAAHEGAEIHWRDPITAADDSPTVMAVEDFLRYHNDTDAVAVIQCTSPFLQPRFLSDAYQKMVNNNLDCIFSATRVFSLRWIDNGDGLVRPLNFDPRKRPRRQDWNGELIENGMFYFFKKELVIEDGLLQNNRCGVLEIPKEFALEIDAETDLLIARSLYKFFGNGENN